MLEFRVLGPFEALRDGVPVALGAPKQRGLLAVLVLRAGQVVSAERLVEELWVRSAPATALDAIHVYVSRLRKALGADVVATRAPGYVLDVEPDCCDAVRFERLLASAREQSRGGGHVRAAELLREALGLWRGDALENVGVPLAEAEAGRLSELRVVAFEERIEADLNAGAGAEFVAELEALCTEHPLRERFWAQRMLALYRSGRQADALQAYRDLARLLDDELGVEPGAELRELETAILRQEPELTPAQARPSPVSVPAPITTFVGRERDLREVEALLDSHRLVTLAGLGGSGKTRLSIEIARRSAGVLGFIELGSVNDPALVAAAVAAGLGVRDIPGQPTEDTLIAQIGSGLLVLDNCEHVREAASALASRLLTSSASLTILVTSREPLGVSGEAVRALGGLDREQASSLFCDRASAVSPGIVLDEDVVAEVCSRLGGLPLAIELAASHTRVLTVEQVSDRLRQTLEESAVDRAIEWSVGALGEREQRLFERCAAFAAWFDLDTTEDVCVGDALSRRDVLPALVRLADMSLLVSVRGVGGMRYRLLEPVREHAARRLDASGQGPEVRDRHLANTLSRVVRSSPAEIDLFVDDVRAALSWGLEGGGDAEVAVRLANEAADYFGLRGRIAEARRWSEGAAAASAAPLVRADALLHAATNALIAGDAVVGRRLLEECVDLARDAGPEGASIATRANFNLGAEALMRGDFDFAESRMRETVQAATDLGLDGVRINARHNLGYIASQRSDYEAAQEHYEAVLQDARAAGEDVSANLATYSLGDLARVRGDLAQARRLFDEALSDAKRIGFARGIVAALGGLAIVATLAEELADAEVWAIEGLDAAREIGDPLLEAQLLASLADIAQARGDLPRAHDLASSQLEIARAVGHQQLVGRATQRLAVIALDSKQHASASVLIADAMGILRTAGERSEIASCLEVAAALLAADDSDSAGVLIATASQIRAEAGVPRVAREEALIAQIGSSPHHATALAQDDAIELALARLRS